jgi:alkaline phosphatase D
MAVFKNQKWGLHSRVKTHGETRGADDHGRGAVEINDGLIFLKIQKRMKTIGLLILLSSSSGLVSAAEVKHSIADGERIMISGEIWANPMEDWKAQDGWMMNTQSGGNRNVVSLISEVKAGDFHTSVEIKKLSAALKSQGFVGFQYGIQGHEGDYRESAIYGVGVPAGLDAQGRLFIGTVEEKAPQISIGDQPFTLSLKAEKGQLTIRYQDAQQEKSWTRSGLHESWQEGSVALTVSTKALQPLDLTKKRASTAFGGIHFGRGVEGQPVLKPMDQGRGGEALFAFKKWEIAGEAVTHHPERHFGPIWWATYTVDQTKTLRLLAQMGPIASLRADEPLPTVELTIGGETHRATMERESATALFQLTLKDTAADLPYTLRALGDEATGLVRAVPGRDRPLTIASLSCNDSTGFPHGLLEENVRAHRPDFITFHGDQIYEEIGGYGQIITQQPTLRATISYLRKYAMHGWTWRRVLMSTPSITIPDDHDVMHGNLWGDGGRAADMTKNTFEAQDSGGYKMSVPFVNMVHQTQTGNLPKASDQPKCASGITTYYTSFRYGPLDFAVLADRQFKSAPKVLFPEAQIKNGFAQNTAWDPAQQSRTESAQLLGPVQEAFLAKWAAEENKESPLRIVISQAPFLAPQTLPRGVSGDSDVPKLPVYKVGDYAPDDVPQSDYDTNGWPQDKQKIALRHLKTAGALHIVGDQHLATTGQYGIDDYADGSWWIATPATANVWPRRWMPSVKAANAQPEWPRWKGGFVDGFGNKFTMHAVANPHDIEREPARLFDRAVGYAITVCDPTDRTFRVAAWPYTAGPQRTGDDARPYPGWPITIKRDNP